MSDARELVAVGRPAADGTYAATHWTDQSDEAEAG